MSKADRWNERYAGNELIWSAGPNALFAEAVAQLESGTALDIACGEGRNALWLAKQGWQVSAMDFSSVAIDKAKKVGLSVSEKPFADATALKATLEGEIAASKGLEAAPRSPRNRRDQRGT